MDTTSDLVGLGELARALEALDLRRSPAAARLRDRVVRVAGDYLTRRSDDAARVVALVGASGVGKSTLVNALAGGVISDAGERRPTTVEPVVWVGGAVPPTLDGLRRTVSGWISSGGLPPPDGVVVVDTPPPDVTAPDGTSNAEAVVDVADACVLVVSAVRYADASGIALALRARERGLPVALVVNRLPQDESVAAEIVDAAATLLHRSGIGDSVPTHRVAETSGGVVERDAVAGLSSAIAGWGVGEAPASPKASEQLVARIVGELRLLLSDIEERRVTVEAIVDAAYRGAAESFASELVAGRFADAGRSDAPSVLAAAVARHAGRAARAAAQRWEADEPGQVAGHPELFLADPSTPAAAVEAIDRWASATELFGRSRGLRAAWVTAAVGGYEAVEGRRRRRATRVGLVELARDRLAEAAETVFERDARRFLDVLGPPTPPTVLAALEREFGP